jgi:hypothetical protein
MAARCGWCGRFRLGGAWLEPDDVPGFRPTTAYTTHTICPDCVQSLRDAGLSS